MEETLQPKIIESPPRDETVGFDLRTEIKDAKTGRMIRFQPYTMIVDRNKGTIYSRNGKFYTLNGKELEGYGIEDTIQAASKTQVTSQGQQTVRK